MEQDLADEFIVHIFFTASHYRRTVSSISDIENIPRKTRENAGRVIPEGMIICKPT